MLQKTNAEIYLSNPGVLCCAGNSLSALSAAAAAGSTEGIAEAECCGKKFFIGRIDDCFIPPSDDRFDMRILRIVAAALEQIRPAVDKAKSRYGADRVGVCIGSCDNGSELSLEAHRAFFAAESFPKDYRLEIQGASYPASFVSRICGVSGISLAFSTACSSSASALAKARQLILGGLCDAVIAGGADIVSQTVLLGFDSLQAVSEKICNPFSKNRSGITLGEGAAFFLLAKDDIDSSGVVLAGCGESADASHITSPRADGYGAQTAMNAALADAKIFPDCIDYVNLHGTGTVLNDSMEAAAVASVLPADVIVSSTKPITGHTLGAAGALELALCMSCMQQRILPCHCWDGIQDPLLPHLNFAHQNHAAPVVRYCMSNSFAFGGCNVSLIIRNIRC